MQTTSETWKSLWANGNAWLETKAVIAGVEYTDISAPVINRAAMQGGLGVGNAVSASLSLAVRTTDDIPKSAPVEILMRLTDGTTSSEWLPAGVFYISKRARDPVAGVQSFECYDALLKGNAALDEVPWTTEGGEQITTEDDVPIMFNAFYPRDMASLVTDIAIILGVELDARTVINTGAEYVVSNPAAGSTIRDLLGTVAAAHGGNWIITPEGKLRLVPVISASGAAAATEDVADIVGTVGSIYVGDSAIISGVRYTAGEAEPVLIGDETGVIIDVNLPYALAHNLAQALIGTTYQPYTMSSAIYDPAAELGDYVRSGSDVASVLYSEAALLGPAFRGNISAPEPSEIADEFPYIGASAKALTEAKAFAIEKATEITEALDESLNQDGIFNRLTDNGEVQGLYLYEGKVYLNASYIRTGEMVADRIKGGTLTMGGLNDVSGLMLVKNANNIEVLRIDRKGLRMFNPGNNYYLYLQDSSLAFALPNPDNSTTHKGSIGYRQIIHDPDEQGTDQHRVDVTVYRTASDISNGFDAVVNIQAYPNHLYVSADNGVIADLASGCSFQVLGDFSVTGTKSRVVSTDQYSDRLLYCYETPSPIFGDIGEGVIGDDGRCYIWLDPVFAQTISTDQYQVFLQRYDDGNCYVSERKGSYFIVTGTPGMAFGWEIKAKQKDYDQRRLDRDDEPFTVPTQTYGADAAKYIDDIKKERISA